MNTNHECYPVDSDVWRYLIKHGDKLPPGLLQEHNRAIGVLGRNMLTEGQTGYRLICALLYAS
jgi:hypothetical protein